MKCHPDLPKDDAIVCMLLHQLLFTSNVGGVRGERVTNWCTRGIIACLFLFFFFHIIRVPSSRTVELGTPFFGMLLEQFHCVIALESCCCCCLATKQCGRGKHCFGETFSTALYEKSVQFHRHIKFPLHKEVWFQI